MYRTDTLFFPLTDKTSGADENKAQAHDCLFLCTLMRVFYLVG